MGSQEGTGGWIKLNIELFPEYTYKCEQNREEKKRGT
jgi:hypothetical protein